MRSRNGPSETAKLANAEATGPKLDGFSEEDWPKRVDYAKGVGTLCEYALATTAAQPGLAPAKVVELMDALLAVNPKSTYIGVAARRLSGGAWQNGRRGQTD